MYSNNRWFVGTENKKRERVATGLVSYTFCAAMAPDLATTFPDAKVIRIQNM